jgi:adenylosuccinate synthase
MTDICGNDTSLARKELIVLIKQTTRVGAGVLPTEQLNSYGEALQSLGHEIGVTT